MTKINSQQERIPVGCIPPAAVTMGERGSASVHAGIHPPRCGLGDPRVWVSRPPGVGLETPLDVGLETPQARPLNFPPRCGPGNLQSMLRYHPWRPAARHAGIPPFGVGLPQCMLGYTHLTWLWAWRPPGCGPGDRWVWAWRPSWVWAWRPPWVWAWRPPRPHPSTSLLGVGWETPLARYLPPMNRKTDRQV